MHERAFRSAATRHQIDRSCVPYLMSAVKSAAAPNGGAGQAASMARRQVLGSAQPPASSPLGASRRGPYSVPATWLWHTMRPWACRNKGEADAAGLVKSGRLWL
jgi:hypothetical protein